MDGESVYNLMESEAVTFAAGVPTVWMMLLQYMEQHHKKLSTLKRTLIGGSAVPQAMVRKFMETYGVDVIHAWGMTELSPLGTVCSPTRDMQSYVSAGRLRKRIREQQTHMNTQARMMHKHSQTHTQTNRHRQIG